jgi:hypothetical protein
MRGGIATFLAGGVCCREDENQDTRDRYVAQFTGAQASGDRNVS